MAITMYCLRRKQLATLKNVKFIRKVWIYHKKPKKVQKNVRFPIKYSIPFRSRNKRIIPLSPGNHNRFQDREIMASKPKNERIHLTIPIRSGNNVTILCIRGNRDISLNLDPVKSGNGHAIPVIDRNGQKWQFYSRH